MRLSLSNEARFTLERIQTRCKEINPSVETASSTFLIQLLDALEGVLEKEQWSTLANRLTSERIKRKRIIERLIKLGDKVDESDIEKFESKIDKKCIASVSSISQKSAENS